MLELGAATLGESGGLPMHPRLAAAWPGAAVAAPAYPVRCSPADNLAIHAAVTRAREGSVLVVDASDDARARVLGRSTYYRGRGGGWPGW